MQSAKKIWSAARSSIAFYPAIIAVVFTGLSVAMLELDFSEMGVAIKASHRWLRLRDASTARSIASTIASGMLSFVVFSFSMVMILLTQAAGGLSNRILLALIGQRFQQVVLGCYIGTILYALFLLTAIRDVDSGFYVPALSIYLLILFTLTDIFLFIYFLHFVTQSVRYETIIDRILKKTEDSLHRAECVEPSSAKQLENDARSVVLHSPVSGYYQGFEHKRLLHAASDAGVLIRILHPVGTYLLEGAPLAEISGNAQLSNDAKKTLCSTIDFHTSHTPEVHYLYGFRQITEIALRALSPGINDPETAVQSIHALGRLLLARMQTEVTTSFTDADGKPRIQTHEPDIAALVQESLWPVWDYGKKDRFVQNELGRLLEQLLARCTSETDAASFRHLLTLVKKAQASEEKGV